ncbi:sugar O-acetyltransferase [Pseudomonas sp. gcc21]|uniref:sugar O-acetyltransferase n=1 Tax=Pseudomonas sp. gcc21 TaxID=2726989 RepID=UPI00273D79A1|nr:sugar O-acetyltransferase [Pseudomonas sp. gcc21]
MSNNPVAERDRMLRGELYDPLSPELVAARNRARLLTKAFNATSDNQQAERDRLLRELVPDCGSEVTIEPPFLCDYGDNISLGDKVFFNFNCVILDVAHVAIGSNVLFGPGVQVYAATHPMSAAQRRTGLELGKPVSIGHDVWIGGGAIICPGVTIGAGTVIGAGSVVIRDIPAGVFAAGNPCRVIRPLED